MRLKGIDMSAHIAKKVRPDIIKKSDLILVMSVYQKKYIENTWPLSKGKTYRLGHWQSMDILDPYQHNQEVFNETCYLIQNCVEDWTRII